MTDDEVTAADLMVFEPRQIAVPGTGELVMSNDAEACAQALLAVRAFEGQLREAKAELTSAIVEQSSVWGTKTLRLSSGGKAVVKGGTEVVWNPEGLEADLRLAGMPEERIRQIVRENVSYSVVAGEAKRAAAANPEYARAVEANRREVERSDYVSFSR